MVSNSQAVLYRTPNLSVLVENDDQDAEYYELYFQQFGINDARQLIEQAFLKPRERSVQVLVVRTEFITHEAQNALLKLFEEPPTSTRLILVVPLDLQLLPTLLSRLQVVVDETTTEGKLNEDFAKFISATYADRLAEIETAQKKKDTAWQRSIKNGLINHLKLLTDKRAVSELEFVARTLLTRGASNKMLLEQLALTLPIRRPTH